MPEIMDLILPILLIMRSGSKRLTLGFRMIYAVVPSSQGFGVVGQWDSGIQQLLASTIWYIAGP